MSYFVSLPPMSGAPGEVHSSLQNPLGSKATDNAGNDHIYLKGVASVVATDFVTFDEAFASARLVKNAVGKVAVATAAVDSTSKYGWFQIGGSVSGNAASSVADNAAVFASATTGRVDDAGYIGDQIMGATFRSTSSSNAATIELGNPSIGLSQRGTVFSKIVPFVEQAGDTLTGTVPLPAGSHLLEIQFVVVVLAGGTSASLIIGDDDDPNGWLAATDLKATDLVVGQVFSIINSGVADTDSSGWHGLKGAYLTNVGRKGNTEAGVNSGTYYGASNNVIAEITQGTPSTTGRYYMIVTYSVPETIAAVVA